jgi:hypothetical protein
MFHRRICDRVRVLAPFLSYDSESVPRREQRPDLLDSGCITQSTGELPVRHAGDVPRGRLQLHPQLRENRHRRVQRHDDDVSGRAEPIRWRSPSPRIFPGMLRPLPPGCRPTSVSTCGTRKTSIEHPVESLRDVPHDQSIWSSITRRTSAGAGARVGTERDNRCAVLNTVMRLPGEKRTEFIQLLPSHRA